MAKKITDKNGIKIEVGDRIKFVSTPYIFRVVSLDMAPQLYNETKGHPAWCDFRHDWERVSNNVVVIEKGKKNRTNRTSRRTQRKGLYLASDKNGVTMKLLANVMNERGVNTFGNSPLQALSRYEDKYGRRLDNENGVIWKLVPYRLRQDKNGNARVGREIK